MAAADAVAVVTSYLRTLFEFGQDAADGLTVLHNRTNMVRVFGNSVTVKNSGGETRTRCVTSCAGSTAFLTVVAQTRRGFLSGGSAAQTADLSDTDKAIQLEEAHARVTVALTRARRLCVLLCPLDQKGPIGAATVLGCLQYGLGHLTQNCLHMPLWQESASLMSPSDASFLNRLENMTPYSLLPPLALVVMRPSRFTEDFTFIRLHLVVVDLKRHWSPRRKGLGVVWQQLRYAAPYCTPMSTHDSISHNTFDNTQYVFGYARDNSTFPVFLLNPARWQQESFCLVALVSAKILPLDVTPEIHILSLEHFYDSFRAVSMTSLHPVILDKYGLTAELLSQDLRVSQVTAAAITRPDVRDLGPEEAAEYSDDDQASGPPLATPRDVRDQEGEAGMSQVSLSSSEDTSAVFSGTDDEEHDQELFLEAYTASKRNPGQFNTREGLRDWFDGVERLPDSWPLARLSVTLDGLVMQVEKVAMTAAMQIIASHVAPEQCLPELTQLAKDLTVSLALHLADRVATFLNGVLVENAVLLVGTATSPLLQASYWVRPIYEELLYASSHTYQGADGEARRASNGLVKIISGKVTSAGYQPQQTAGSCISPLTVFGRQLSASVLQIWFPAHWTYPYLGRHCS